MSTRTSTSKLSIIMSGCVLMFLVNGCTTAMTSPQDAQCTATNQSSAQATKLVTAADSRFRYEGRFDFSDSNAPVIIWEASRVRLDFSGDILGLHFDGAKGQNFFNAEVDGSNTIVETSEGQPIKPVMLAGFGPGRHHLLLFKRSEASAGTVRFCGVELATNAKAWAPKLPDYKLRMEFIGDSITVGACNEDDATDQWTNRVTHNSALSYAALTAAAFNADHRNISVSGMGVATGWVSMTAGKIWNRLYPDTNSPLADLTRWVPQVVLVNFGENDDSFTRNNGYSFPAAFTEDYIALIHATRSAYPKAHIVLLRGGMFGGARSEPFCKAWEVAVARLESNDPNISHYVFTHWSPNRHPRVTDDRIMADELIKWLNHQKFMRAY